MVWVKFSRNFSYKPSQQVTIDYQGGFYANVPTAHAEAAIDAGAGVKEEPKKGKARDKAEASEDVTNGTTV